MTDGPGRYANGSQSGLVNMTLAIFCLLITFLLIGLSYSGFCFKEFRYLSDQEKINIAITSILESNRDAVVLYEDNSFLYPYKDVDDFLISNPNCCEIVNNIGTGNMDWLDRLLGHLTAYIYIEFIGVYKNKIEKKKGIIAITNCGESWYPY